LRLSPLDLVLHLFVHGNQAVKLHLLLFEGRVEALLDLFEPPGLLFQLLTQFGRFFLPLEAGCVQVGDLGVLLLETLLEALHLILEEVVGLLQLFEVQTAARLPPCLAVAISPDLVLLLVVCLAPSLVVL
jgi:hypothetical protein